MPEASNARDLRTEVWDATESVGSAPEQPDNDKEGDSREPENSEHKLDAQPTESCEKDVKGEGPVDDDAAFPESSPAEGVNGSNENVNGVEESEGEVEEDNPNAQPVDQTLVRLSLCREEEKELRKSFVILAFPFEMDDESKQISKWYIVEASWFRQWSKFLQGAPRPGPITNQLLFGKDGQPRDNLRPGEHYFGMDKEAWSQLSDRYGCDVAICKSKYDIYT